MPGDTVDVLLNVNYGGFNLSRGAMREYRRRTGKDYPGYPRHDATMVAIVRELGAQATEYGSVIGFESIPAHFAGYYTIVEYDGAETLQIEYDAYIIDRAKAVLRDGTLTKAEKIARAYAVLNAKSSLAAEAQDL
jgi:hypothetical protein